MFGRSVRTFAFNTDGAALMPSDERSFVVGSESVADSLSGELQSFGIGPYRVEADLRADGMPDLRVDAGRFFVMPWRSLVFALFLSAILTIILGFLLPKREHSI